ncbi:leucine-rich repeat-containing protein 20-like [Acanthaster planci]|uniref:Leucine-rich repeat-containing protein 20-like n=1 Tax=Acanthaster planci TaxID=133434 RepID=A0A8B7XI08_ACAPL|nr:leucine-rich repeat-containing protein 20-like [Acanthaster planci]
MRIVSMAAGDVTRVVHRCEQASEDCKLDLSHCLLTAFPDAVFHLTRHTTIESCDLSHNLLKKLPAKFAATFVHLKVLDLSSNKLESLQDGLSRLHDLQTLNLANNVLTVFPAAIISSLPKLEVLNLQNNSISDVDCQCLSTASSTLQEINLEGNPLTNNCRTLLKDVMEVNIKMTHSDEH